MATERPAPPLLALVSRDPRFELECPRTWDSLARTTDPEVRHCDSCRHLVHRVHSDADLVEHARRGHCVSLLPDPYTWPPNAMRTGRPREVPPGADTAWLTLLNGDQAGTVLVLVGAAVTVGSGPADLVLPDPSLAAQHLRFVRAQGRVHCHDLTAPDQPPRDLLDGDVLVLGELRAIFKTAAYPSDDR